METAADIAWVTGQDLDEVFDALMGEFHAYGYAGMVLDHISEDNAPIVAEATVDDLLALGAARLFSLSADAHEKNPPDPRSAG